MKKISGIYCIENLIDGKKYIGKAININNRFNFHRNSLRRGNHYNDYLQHSWNKYGEENFKFYIIEECSREELIDREIYWIDKLNTFFKNNNGYNLTKGGDGNSNPSEETRRKMSENHADFSGENHPLYGKRGKDSPNYGKHCSEETKSKISQSNIGKQSGKNHPSYGKHRSNETKRKISLSKVGDRNPMYGKKANKKQLESLKLGRRKGKNHSDETKKKMSRNRCGENAHMYAKKRKNASSKYYGVGFHSQSNKWRCRIRENKKEIPLGLYDLEIDAAKAYNEYVIKNKLNRPLNVF